MRAPRIGDQGVPRTGDLRLVAGCVPCPGRVAALRRLGGTARGPGSAPEPGARKRLLDDERGGAVTLLESVQGPADLKRLEHGELVQLAAEIRSFLIAKVSR